MVDDTFVLLSAWWVKSLVFIAAALMVDVARRERPWRALTVAVAFGLSSLCSTLLKVAVDRPRPTTATLVDIPTSASFPSGHATTAFAAAVALSLLVPRMTFWALPLAAAIACSRVYLEVHYWTDIAAGALLGTFVTIAVVRAVGAVRRRARSAAGSGLAAAPRAASPSG